MLTSIRSDSVKLVVTATIVIVLTAVLVRQRRASPKTEGRTSPVDNIPIDQADDLNRNPKSIAEQDPDLDGAATARSALTLNPKSLTFRVDDIPIKDANDLETNLRSIAERDPALQGDADTMVRCSLVRHGDSLCATISIKTSLPAEELSKRLRRAGAASRRSARSSTLTWQLILSRGSTLVVSVSASDASSSTSKMASSGEKESSESYLSLRERWRRGMMAEV